MLAAGLLACGSRRLSGLPNAAMASVALWQSLSAYSCGGSPGFAWDEDSSIGAPGSLLAPKY